MLGITRPTDRKAHRKANRASTQLKLESLESREVPAIIANPDAYDSRASQVLTVLVPEGVLANDFSDTNPGSVLFANIKANPIYANSPVPLPRGSLIFNPNGSFTFITPNIDRIPINSGPVVFQYSVTSTTGEPTATGTVTINILEQNEKLVAVGADAGGGPHVRVYLAGTAVQKFNFFPYEPQFTGGVRVAVGDVTNDGIDDIVTMPATGGAARLRVYDGKDGANIIDQFVFDVDFRGGGYVAVGDYNGDTLNDIIVGAGEGGGPRVSVFTVAGVNTLTTIADFFAYSDEVRTGVRVAAGDLNGIGRENIITAPGVGGGPQINIYDGVRNRGRLLTSPISSFFGGDVNDRNGIFIATGNTRGDGKYNILVGAGGGPGVVREYDGRTVGLVREFAVPVDETASGGGTPNGPGNFNLAFPSGGTLIGPSVAPTSLLPSTTVGNPFIGSTRGGIRVAAVDWNKDGLDDIITGAGPGNAPRVRIFNTRDNTEIINLLPFSSTFNGGVNVAASSNPDDNIAQDFRFNPLP